MKGLAFTNVDNFRVKLALSLITLKPFKVIGIRSNSPRPGVNDAEVSLLKLIDEITNGTFTKINDTGTCIQFIPGSLNGGSFNFVCCNERGIGYYVELLLLLAPFCKTATDVHLYGITNSVSDPSIEMIQKCWIPLYKLFVGASSASYIKLEVLKRGLLPEGGGEVIFSMKPCCITLPVQRLIYGKVFKIRGIAWSCSVSSAYGNKLIAGAKSILNRFLSDVYITLDHRKDETAGLSPGFGLTLWAESKNGAMYAAEAISQPQLDGAPPVDADTIGKTAANRLLNEIYRGGFVDSGAQSLILCLMACESERNVSQLSIGPLTPYTVQTLKLIREMLGITFHFDYRKEDSIEKITEETATGVETTESSMADDTELLVATCFGAGTKNVSRSIR